jgi:hypothetical protein
MKALEIAPAADTIDPVFAAVLARTPEKAIVMQHSGEGETSLIRACPARCAHLLVPILVPENPDAFAWGIPGSPGCLTAVTLWPSVL